MTMSAKSIFFILTALAVDASRVHKKSAEQELVTNEAPNTKVRASMMLTRQCMQEKAEEFPRLMQRFGKKRDASKDTAVVELVVGKWMVEDLIENHFRDYGFIKKMISERRSSTIANYRKELAQIAKALAAEGFSYDVAMTSCKSGHTTEMHTCMIKQGEAFEKSKPLEEQSPMPVGNWVNISLFLEEVRMHSYTADLKVPSGSRLWYLIKASNFPYYKAKSSCEQAQQGKMVKLLGFLDLQVKPVQAEGACVEDDAKGYCPEGLAPTVARPIDPVKGSTAASITYFSAWPVMSVVAPSVGFLLGGPAGMSAGNLFAHFSPVPYGPPLAAVAYMIFSTGSRTCQCFPRECKYDAAAGACAIGGIDGASDSKNPFGRSLPFMSQKCVRSKKNKDTCEMKSCDVADFTPSLKQSMFGTVGPQGDGGVYNCLSSSGDVADTLLLHTKLPDGQDNTAMNRAKIFEKLGVESKPDEDAPDEQQQQDQEPVILGANSATWSPYNLDGTPVQREKE